MQCIEELTIFNYASWRLYSCFHKQKRSFHLHL